MIDPEKAMEDLEETCLWMYWQDVYDQTEDVPLTEEEIDKLVRRVVDGG